MTSELVRASPTGVAAEKSPKPVVVHREPLEYPPLIELKLPRSGLPTC